MAGPARTGAGIRLPEFAGQEHEDPRTFGSHCRDLLARYGIPLNEWMVRVSDQLRGAARDWWAMVGEGEMAWDDFISRLESRFDDARARAHCQRSLWCTSQGDDEDVESFIRAKVRLHRRLTTGSYLSEALGLVVELMKWELLPHLRGATGRDLEDFMQLAKEIERDVQPLPQPLTTRARQQGTARQQLIAPEDRRVVVPYRVPAPQNATLWCHRTGM
ncbi:activity-regulated cytoskeleton-associated protein-like [Bacillus rossius redtenbacheri]|uniref:activity-regulated cytoskeleton-associated protein-like n=1 Tax=Bacillus rossius redtenbacheri TaxID=93214 RepID=UPI002FDE0961